MEIEILDHNYSRIIEPDSDVIALLSYKSKIYNKRMRSWKIDTHCLIDNSGLFLTGLVPYVLENNDVRVTNDLRTWFGINYKDPDLTVTLRDYQISYLTEALKRKRMIVDSVTGSGKTTIMAAIMATLNVPTLILVPNKTVLAQLSQELQSLLPSFVFGTASGGKVDWKGNLIGLASTLVKMPVEQLRLFKVLLVDEAHTCAAAQAMDVILRMNGGFRFGFTGTVTGRSDGRDLVVQGLLGEPVKITDSTELMKQGYLAKTEVDMHYAAWDGDYATLEELLIVRNVKRNELIVKLATAKSKDTVLILVRRIEHGKILQTMIKKSVFVSGEMDGPTREDVRQAVKEGKIKVLIASNVMSMGLDIPNLTLGINAVGDKSEILTKQRMGRIMRPWQDMCKKWVDIYDKYHPTLEQHAKDRIKNYKEASVPVNLIGFPWAVRSKVEREVL